MNFKPNLWKTILSIGVGLCGSIIISTFLPHCTDISSRIYNPTNQQCLSLGPVFIFITFLIITVGLYLIWSMIQKNRS